MKILVTGHKGYVGGTLVPLLQERNYSVRGLDLDLFRNCAFTDSLSQVEEELIKDVRDVTSSDLEGCEAVLHLAGLCNDPLGDIDPALTYDINHEATVKLAKAARLAGVKRFVFASSCSIYGAGGEEWLDENSQLNPVTPYACSKLKAEISLKDLADDQFCPVFLRAATAYGVSPKLRFDLVLNNLVAWALASGWVKLKSDGTPWRPLVHVEDLGRAFMAALEAPAEQVWSRAYNVGTTSENFRVRELAGFVQEATGSRIMLSEEAGPDRRCYRVNCDRIQVEMPQYQPRWTAKKGIHQLVQLLTEQPVEDQDFEGSKFDRKMHLMELLSKGQLNKSLRAVVSN